MGRRTNTAVWLEKYKRWQIKVQKDGIRKTFTSSTPGRTGQREANKKADEWLDDGIEGINNKVSEVTNKFLAYVKLHTSDSNYQQHKNGIENHIKPLIGNKKIRALTESALQEVIDTAYKKGLSKKSLQAIRNTINLLLRFCRKEGYTKLVLEGLEIPKDAPEGERNVLQPASLKKLFSCNETILYQKATHDFFVHLYRFLAVVGIRPGEAFGLNWSDITGGQIFIRRSITRKGEERKGKNKNAIRHFALTSMAQKILKEQKQNLSAHGLKDCLYVFPNEAGDRMNDNHLLKRWKKFCAHNEIAQTTVYELRHTFVSVVKHLPPSVVKSLVGHSESMDTLGVYGHEIDGEAEKAAKMVQSVFEKYIS